MSFPASHKFAYILFSFSFVLIYFLLSLEISSLNYWLFKSVLFNFHIFVDFPYFILSLFFSVIPLWLEKILCVISGFLNLLRLVLHPKLWFVPENSPCAFEKHVYSGITGWNIPYKRKNPIGKGSYIVKVVDQPLIKLVGKLKDKIIKLLTSRISS